MVIDGKREWVQIFNTVWDSPCIDHIGQHEYILSITSSNGSTIDATSREMP